MFNFRNQPVKFLSETPAASITIDGKTRGTGTIVKTKLRRDLLSRQIRKEAPGYITGYSCIFQIRKSPIYFFSLMPGVFLFYPPVADTYPKAFDYKRKVTLPPLTKRIVRAENQRYLTMSDVGFDVKANGLRYYKIRVKDLQKNLKVKKQQQDTNYMLSLEGNRTDDTERVMSAQNTYFSEEMEEVLLLHGFTDSALASLRNKESGLSLSVQISNIDVVRVVPNNVRRKIYTSYYFIQSNITWKVLNNYGEENFRISIPSRSGEFAPDYFQNDELITHKMINDLLINSFNTLLADKQIQTMLNSRETFKPLPEIRIAKSKQVCSNVDEARESTVTVTTPLGHGSGFAINQEGYIITNYHVIAGPDTTHNSSLKVIDFNGEEFAAKLIQADPEHDLALLKIDKTFLKAFQLPDSVHFDLGDNVYIIGSPRSIELGQSLASGIISSEQVISGKELIQLNISINGGNSGGPVFAASSFELVGVANSKLSGRDVTGVGFCVPAHKITQYLQLRLE
jgi:S1-C subfamily serine protease